MTVDEFLFNSLKTGESKQTLRFFRWVKPTISFGFNQKSIGQVIDIDKCHQLGIDIVKRPTGGRELLHGFDLSYSVIGHTDDSNSTLKSIKSLCLKIHEAIIEGLKAMGLESEGFRSESTHNKGYDLKGHKPCFSSVTGDEITYFGKKIVGSAQRREDNVFLQHGSIQLIDGTAYIANLLNINGYAKRRQLLKKIKESVTSITKALGYSNERIEDCYRNLEKNITESFSVIFGIEFDYKNLNGNEMKSISKSIKPNKSNLF